MAKWQLALEAIGRELDQGGCPRVGKRGVVMASQGPESSATTREDRDDVRPRPRRSEPGSGEGPAGREGASGGQGSAGRQEPSDTPPPFVGAGIGAQYEAELNAVQTAYPGTSIWRQDGGFWLLSESVLLPGLGQSAVFLTGISPQKKAVKSWGFWRYGCIDHRWIGPRHTNFPDGSVCAFEPRDETWVFGDPLVDLLDLYSLWALRHLHLNLIGRWPGPQAVSHPYERLMELREDELCGCGTYVTPYGACCAPKDRSLNRIRVAVNFLARVDSNRAPPPAIVATVCRWAAPPPLDSFFEQIGYIPMTSGGVTVLP